MSTRGIRTHVLNALMVVALLGAILAGIPQVAGNPQSASAEIQAGARRYALVASAARTATGTGTATCGLAPYTKFAAEVSVTAASGTSPTLDVTWQHSIDGGTTWFTVVAFTQKTATGNELKVEAEVEAATAEVYGDCMRMIWTVGGTTPSFTFSGTLSAQ